MAYLLSNLLQDTYMGLGQLNVSTATGGSTSTVVDSKQAGLHGDNTWKNGAAFVVRDAGGAAAAPEGEFGLVTAYTDSSGTFAATFTVAPATGDTYAFVNDFYPLYTVIELCNMGLAELGDIALTDTSLTTATSAREYTLAVAMKRGRPLQIALQGQTGDADDNARQILYDWDVYPAAAGTGATIVFQNELVSGRTLYVTYEGIHPKLSAYSSIVSETIHPRLASASCVEMCLRWQNSRLQGGDDFLLQRWNDAKMQLEMAKSAHPIWKPRRKPKLMIVGDTNTRLSRYSGDVLP